MPESTRRMNCGQIRTEDSERQICLCGWIHRIRNHGGIYFLDLRDRYGITQAVIAQGPLAEICAELRIEFCISITGTVTTRPEGMINSSMPTGAVEVAVESLEILNTCPALPFMLDGQEETSENLKQQYRYLDLRTEAMTKRLELRHRTTWAVRSFLTSQNFWEIETPTFIRSTPEGARDFLVPSRVNPGRFYALPQSPQLYKQLLMVGGVDKYYQLARCYRDEDSRGDRQPEFTQIDLEMSFASQEDVLSLCEDMMTHVFREVLDRKLTLPFPRLSWKEAMEQYGTDKPDLRFNLQITDFQRVAEESDFGVFHSAIKAGGVIKALRIPGAGGEYSRKQIATLEEEAKNQGAGGLPWLKLANNSLEGGIAKFLTGQNEKLREALKAKDGDLILFTADKWQIALEALGAVRCRVAADLGLYNKNDFCFCWIVDFPLFEKNEETGGWEPAHHMFSMPREDFLENMEDNPGAVPGQLYDLVLNGNELGSGSVRIHSPQLQERVFNIAGLPKNEARKRFGFLLEALRYGAPPHAGAALGFDRLVMIMTGAESLRDVIAFPKNSRGISHLDGSPGPVDRQQLSELGLEIKEQAEP